MARVWTSAKVVAYAWCVAAVGLFGAALFNPDDGALIRSEPLWRVFGIGAYLGAATFVLGLVVLALMLMAVGLTRLARH